MENDLLSIGELARASGLSVSALRFYDRTEVLVPAVVDPVNGYRWYAREQIRTARLVAGLRRVGMPLLEIADAVHGLSEPARVRRLLHAHLRRLEDGLTAARREFSRIHALIDPKENSMSVTQVVLSRTELAAALDAVRFAIADNPEFPVLAGMLIEVEPDTIRLVGTDRYRMAVAGIDGRVTGPAVRSLAPISFVDQLRALSATGPDEIVLILSAAEISARVAERVLSAVPLPDEFPDYHRLLREQFAAAPAHRVAVDVDTLRAALTSANAPKVVREHERTAVEVTVLSVDDGGGLRLVGEEELSVGGDALRVGVNGGFLLDALDAAGQGQLTLELDGPIAPLAVRLPDDDRTFSILMPIQL